MAPIDSHQSDQSRLIYEELGRALATWGAVEAALAGLYCIAVNHDNPQPAVHSYWAVASFEGKLKMSHAAISLTLSDHPHLHAKWTALYGRLNRKKDMRNKLAHGVVQTVTWKSKRGQKFDCFFTPYGFSVRDKTRLTKEEINDPFRDPRPKTRMYYDGIRRAHLSFFQLRQDLWGLSDELFRLLLHK